MSQTFAMIRTEFSPLQSRGISLFLRSKDWGVIGEKKFENGKKQAFLWGFCPFSGNFRGKATASDSVIRWFESSYPSQGYHILYCEYLWIQYMVF